MTLKVEQCLGQELRLSVKLHVWLWKIPTGVPPGKSLAGHLYSFMPSPMLVRYELRRRRTGVLRFCV